MGRDLDVRVARSLGKSEPPTLHDQDYFWRRNDDGTFWGDHYFGSYRAWEEAEWPPPYSTNISVAWTLINDYISPGYWPDGRPVFFDMSVQVFRSHNGTWTCGLNVWQENDGMHTVTKAQFSGRGDTAPEAICLAFLAMKGE